MVICTNKLRPEALAPILAESTAGTLALHTFDVGVLDAVATDELLDHLVLDLPSQKLASAARAGSIVGPASASPASSSESPFHSLSSPLVLTYAQAAGCKSLIRDIVQLGGAGNAARAAAAARGGQ